MIKVNKPSNHKSKTLDLGKEAQIIVFAALMDASDDKSKPREVRKLARAAAVIFARSKRVRLTRDAAKYQSWIKPPKKLKKTSKRAAKAVRK